MEGILWVFSATIISTYSLKKDEQAFKLIYNETKKNVYAIIRSIVKNEQITEDLMQDTYIKAIEKIRSYKRNGKFQVWINSIAHNISVDYFRKNKKTIALEDVEYQLKTEVNHESRMIAEALLKTISPIEKQIVLLHVIDNYTFKDIAELIDKPIGTVLWLYNKAIQKMRTEG